MNNDPEEEFIESSMLGNDSHNYIIHRDDMDGDGENSNPLGDPDCKGDQPLREQDRFLPIANIAKIMKRAIPESGKIAKDARECVQECVSEFVSFITSEASERCQLEKRKTINGEDILYSMTSLGFDGYIDPLKLYLQKYREATKGDKSAITGMYEEVVDETFSNQNISEGMIQEPQRQTEVIYTYSDQLQQFNLV